MIDPTKHRQLEELDTVNLCTQIFTNARNELYLNMHYLDLALSNFGFEADPTLSSVATDGFVIYYRPEWVFAMYKRGRVHINRAFLHMVFHCLFCHLDTRGKRAKDYWNLAEPLTDGQMISFPTKEEAAEREKYDTSDADTDSQADRTVADEADAGGRININTAGIDLLTKLPGIGQTRAEAIIAYRDEHGNFSRVEDIMKVSGIKNALFEKMRDDITVD